MSISFIFVDPNNHNYREEADLSYDEYQKDWINEDSICLQLICKIFEAFEFIFKEKLDQNIREQETLVLERMERCRQLSYFISDLKSDEALWTVLSTRIQ